MVRVLEVGDAAQMVGLLDTLFVSQKLYLTERGDRHKYLQTTHRSSRVSHNPSLHTHRRHLMLPILCLLLLRRRQKGPCKAVKPSQTQTHHSRKPPSLSTVSVIRVGKCPVLLLSIVVIIVLLVSCVLPAAAFATATGTAPTTTTALAVQRFPFACSSPLIPVPLCWSLVPLIGPVSPGLPVRLQCPHNRCKIHQSQQEKCRYSNAWAKCGRWGKWGECCWVSCGVAAPDKGENRNDEEDHGPVLVPSR